MAKVICKLINVHDQAAVHGVPPEIWLVAANEARPASWKELVNQAVPELRIEDFRIRQSLSRVLLWRSTTRSAAMLPHGSLDRAAARILRCTHERVHVAVDECHELSPKSVALIVEGLLIAASQGPSEGIDVAADRQQRRRIRVVNRTRGVRNAVVQETDVVGHPALHLCELLREVRRRHDVGTLSSCYQGPFMKSNGAAAPAAGSAAAARPGTG